MTRILSWLHDVTPEPWVSRDRGHGSCATPAVNLEEEKWLTSPGGCAPSPGPCSAWPAEAPFGRVGCVRPVSRNCPGGGQPAPAARCPFLGGGAAGSASGGHHPGRAAPAPRGPASPSPC